MPRPFKNRRIDGEFGKHYFKPQGIPLRMLDEVVLGVDELEAVRLTDLEGMYQADAAEKMKVSRQTLGNIIKSAHAKIADALISGKAIRIAGGPVEFETDEAVGRCGRKRRCGKGRGRNNTENE